MPGRRPRRADRGAGDPADHAGLSAAARRPRHDAPVAGVVSQRSPRRDAGVARRSRAARRAVGAHDRNRDGAPGLARPRSDPRQDPGRRRAGQGPSDGRGLSASAGDRPRDPRHRAARPGRLRRRHPGLRGDRHRRRGGRRRRDPRHGAHRPARVRDLHVVGRSGDPALRRAGPGRDPARRRRSSAHRRARADPGQPRRQLGAHPRGDRAVGQGPDRVRRSARPAARGHRRPHGGRAAGGARRLGRARHHRVALAAGGRAVRGGGRPGPARVRVRPPAAGARRRGSRSRGGQAPAGPGQGVTPRADATGRGGPGARSGDRRRRPPGRRRRRGVGPLPVDPQRRPCSTRATGPRSPPTPTAASRSRPSRARC